MIGRLFLFLVKLVLSLMAAAAAVWFMVLRPMRKTWGVDPAEWSREMPGDELVPDAPLVETRGITIDASPDAVWPWLVQMGFGRAGWYSYDRMDNRGASAERIMPEHQQLAVGDIVPTWPGGGFRVAAIDPGRSLSLFVDSALVKAQQAAAADDAAKEAAKEPTEEAAKDPTKQSIKEAIKGSTRDATAGLKVAGAMGDKAMPEFKASWTFVLEPIEGGHTRVIERIRAWAPPPGAAQQLALPVFGMGVFLMTRRQLLGLKERVERPAPPDEEAVAA